MDEWEVNLTFEPKKGTFPNTYDINGQSLLQFAVLYADFPYLKKLLSFQDLNINYQSIKYPTALNSAINADRQLGNDSIVELLLAHPNIDVNLKGPNGKFPLYSSALSLDVKNTKRLLAHKNLNVNQRVD